MNCSRQKFEQDVKNTYIYIISYLEYYNAKNLYS